MARTQASLAPSPSIRRHDSLYLQDDAVIIRVSLQFDSAPTVISIRYPPRLKKPYIGSTDTSLPAIPKFLQTCLSCPQPQSNLWRESLTSARSSWKMSPVETSRDCSASSTQSKLFDLFNCGQWDADSNWSFRVVFYAWMRRGLIVLCARALGAESTLSATEVASVASGSISQHYGPPSRTASPRIQPGSIRVTPPHDA